MEGVVRITEARLKRDILERKVIDFRPNDSGFEVVRVDALSVPSKLAITLPLNGFVYSTPP